MKKKVIILIIGILCFGNINEVNAHPGGTDSSGCHKCKTNCAKWGLNDGEYHCHNESTAPKSTEESSNTDKTENSSTNSTKNVPTISNNKTTTSKPKSKTTYVKSSDNTIKTIMINSALIDINDNMEYKTKKESATIKISLNHEKASVEYDNEKELSIGDNFLDIIVKAENGNLKKYSLNVIREENLSSNNNIKIMVDKKEVKFVAYKNDKITISSNQEKVNITYELEDEKALVEIKGNENLKVGINEIVLTVIAENGDKQDYTLIVEKFGKSTEIVGTVLGTGILVGSGYDIYKFLKKRTTKNNKK